MMAARRRNGPREPQAVNTRASLTPTALSWIREDLDRLLDRLRLQVENIATNPNPGTVTHSGAAASTDELSNIFGTLGTEGVYVASDDRLLTIRTRSGPLQVACLPDFSEVIDGVVETVSVLNFRNIQVAATTG